MLFRSLLAPFAPHAAEELYSYYRSTSVHLASWPIYNEALLIDDMITIGVQINGKLRGELTVEHDETKESIEARACTLPTIVPYIQQGVKKIIVVPSRIVNIVV